MNSFIDKLYNHLSGNGYNLTQIDLEYEFEQTTGNNEGFLDIVAWVFAHAHDNGYTLDSVDFENEYYKFWGKRPGGK